MAQAAVDKKSKMKKAAPKVVGMSRHRYDALAASQQGFFLPPTCISPSPAVVARIGQLLYARDLDRVSSLPIPGVTLWPMSWGKAEDGDVCTGQPLELRRVTKAMKDDKPNVNFGRFYVAATVPVEAPVDPTTLNGGFKPSSKLVDFAWFDETPFVTSGCFETLAQHMPFLVKLLLKTHGPNLSEKKMWPENLGRILDDLAIPISQHEEVQADVQALVDDLDIPNESQC